MLLTKDFKLVSFCFKKIMLVLYIKSQFYIGKQIFLKRLSGESIKETPRRRITVSSSSLAPLSTAEPEFLNILRSPGFDF